MERRYLRGAAVLIGLGSLVALWWTPSPEPDEPAGPRPSETTQGRRMLEATREPPARPPAEVGDEARHVVLSVPVGRVGHITWDAESGGSTEHTAFAVYDVDPAAYLPGLDEAPWPDAVDLLATDHPDALLDLAEQAGAVAEQPVEQDPWLALVTLHVERRWADHVTQRELAAWEARHGLPDRQEVGAEAYWKARRAVTEPPPSPDPARVLDVVERLLAAHPEHPASEYARLYQLDVLEDRQELVDAASEALLDSWDPIVQHAVAQRLSASVSGGYVPLSAEVLDELAHVHDGLEAAGMRVPLAELGMRSSLASDDAIRARAWADRFAATLPDRSCTLPGMCEQLAEELDQARGWLAARLDEPGATWQADLSGAAIRCAERAPPPEPVLTGEAVWEGRWRFTEWSEDHPIGACLEQVALRGPAPPDGQTVTLHVFEAR